MSKGLPQGLAGGGCGAETGVVEFPLRLGAPADCARVAALFARAGFREEPICRGLGVPNISRIGKVAPAGLDLAAALGSATPAALAGPLRFVGVSGRSPVADALDLCAGTGIAALVLSRHVERVVAADITPRAAHFARFNALLNSRPNVEIAVGDLYDPVAGRTFDRIVAHP